MPIAPEHLIRLQSQPDQIRNICILAHVDHGKTSLSDNLLASNGIISQNLQGKIRYLDSRPDEQARGITMESSAISLYFKVARRPNGQDTDQKEYGLLTAEYLINLIDSPGHIDFSSEVSTASRLCDGAVVVVDVVEGVCSQTVTVLRQAWIEKMKPILVLNKFDRLITELQLSPIEAYLHVSKLIEQVNAVVGSFFAGQRMEDDMKWRERLDGTEFVEASDDDIYFAPEKNNVVFGSAIDGWGFTISQFASIYERKMGMNKSKLEKVLWGDYHFGSKTKTVITGTTLVKGRSYKPLFVQLVLENIWAVYDCTILNKSVEKAAKIVNALGLSSKIQEREMKSRDGRALLTSIFGSWIPMSRAILLSVMECIPSPLAAQKDRIPLILENTYGHGENVDNDVSKAMCECNQNGPLTAFVSKVISYPEKDIPKERKKASVGMLADKLAELRERSRKAREIALASRGESVEETDQMASDMNDISINEEKPRPESEEKIIGFSRVYSGCLRVGQQVAILGPRYNPMFPDQYKSTVEITGLFLFMGRDLVPIDEAPAGNIVGIGGLDGHILKSGTIVSIDKGGPNLASTAIVIAPILRVAIEPVDPTKIPQVEKGLKLLNASDSCVQVSITENGEHILSTAGELHLERCIKDLKERFAKVDIHYSKPIVPYRETIIDDQDKEWKSPNGTDNPRGWVQVVVGSSLELKFQIFPLSSETTSYISTNGDKIRGLIESKRAKPTSENSMELTEIKQEDELYEEVGAIVTDQSKLESLKLELDELLSKNEEKFIGELDETVNRIISFGPKRTGPNILFDGTADGISRHIFKDNNSNANGSEYEDNILTGFQLAMLKGLLCGEPLDGVGCVLLSIKNVGKGLDEGALTSIQGRVISSTREAIHQGISDWSPRIKLATYMCEIQAPSEVLGKVYGVVTKRRGTILREEMKEGTPFFSIEASLPVVEAFGFSEEIRKRTSGSANPQLVFSGFEMLDQDPFWVPTTEEELEELGEKADKENLAMKYVEAVRKRKGLPVHEKLVENAERQRTLKK